MAVTTKLSSGHTIQRLSEDENERIRKDFPNYGPLIRLHPGGWFFEECIPPLLQRIQKFEFRATDVVTMTYPKSGTTWSQEILWTFLKNPNLDNPTATQMLDIRSPHLEGDFFLNLKNATKPSEASLALLRNFFKQVAPERVDDEDLLFTLTDVFPSPRVIKTHLPFSLLPPSLLTNSKVLYVARNPRDVIVSRFSFLQLLKMHNFKGSFQDCLDYFLSEELFYSPFWLHLKEAWDLRHHPNVLFLFFEDMKRDPIKEYEKINHFLGTNLVSQQVTKIMEYTSFEAMKKRAAEGTDEEPMSDGGVLLQEEVKNKTGGFFRQGKAGDWSDVLSEDQRAQMEQWTRRSTIGFPENFPFLAKQ